MYQKLYLEKKYQYQTLKKLRGGADDRGAEESKGEKYKKTI